MGNIVTDGSTAGWLPDAKIADPDRTLDHPEWQISHDDFNDLTSAADVIASHLCGEPDGSGAWFLGGYAQTADPLTATLAGLGTGRWHMWPDSTDDAWKFRESGETAERMLFDDQGIGVLKLDSYAGVTLAPAGKLWLRSNAGTLQTSYDGGAWGAVGGGGGIADSDNVVWTGTHSFEGASFNVNPLATFTAGISMTTATTLVAGANTLVSGDKLQGAHLSFASQAAGDSIYFNGTDWVRLAGGAAGTLLAGGTTPAYTATPTVTSITTGNGSAGSPAVVVGDAGGLYRIADNRIGVAPNGALTHEFAETYFALQTAVSMYFGAPGSTTVPGATWIGDQNTGFSNHTADQVGVILGGVERMLFRAPGSVGRVECDEFRAKNGQDMFFIRATGKAIFGSETSGNITELQSYKTTSATTDAFRAWAFAGTMTAGNLLSLGDGGTYAQKFAVDFAGRCDYPSAITQTTVGGAGAAAALPGAPTGYLHIRIGGVPGTPGTIKLVPYWDWDGP